MAYTARKESEVKEFFDEPSELQTKIKKLAELVKKSKHFVVYTGAGISTACGIADYRSGLNTVLKTGAGKWAKEAATKEGKLSKQSAKKLDNAQQSKRVSTFKAVPSASHMSLVALAHAGILKHLVSQNTDGLHRRSGFPIDQLSEIHGNSTLEECALCSKVYMRDFRCRNKAILPSGALSKIKYIADEIAKALAKDSKYSDFITNDDKQVMTALISDSNGFIRQRKQQKRAKNDQTKTIKQTKEEMMEENRERRQELLENWETVLRKAGFQLPRYLHHTGRCCAVKGCSTQLTDTIINFGESLPRQTLRDAEKQSAKADLYLVLGSSCTVTPAADMPERVGRKWKEEVNDIHQEVVHNLVICNIQKTPLHNVCSLPIHAKIDDVMRGLMKELDVAIPRWCLQRYIKICVGDVGSREDQRHLCVSGVDVDGTGFSLFKSVVLRNDGQRIRKVINNKENRADEYNYIVPVWDVYENEKQDSENKHDGDDVFKKYEVDKSKGLSVELEFCGNYEEPKLVICLNEFLDGFVKCDGQIVLKMMMEPLTKMWCVPNKNEQMQDKDVKLLWRVGNDNDNQQDDVKTDE